MLVTAVVAAALAAPYVSAAVTPDRATELARIEARLDRLEADILDRDVARLKAAVGELERRYAAAKPGDQEDLLPHLNLLWQELRALTERAEQRKFSFQKGTQVLRVNPAIGAGPGVPVSPAPAAPR